MHEKYMRIALKEAEKAKLKDEIPVGAVIVKNNKIIAKGYNQRETKNSVIKHAEIVAIEKANKKNKNWHLDDCIIYVTLEPCMMCSGAIIESHIKTIVYGCNSDKYGITQIINSLPDNKKNNYKINVISNILENDCKKIIKQFFLLKRKK